jgi:hypothetical protein
MDIQILCHSPKMAAVDALKKTEGLTRMVKLGK